MKYSNRELSQYISKIPKMECIGFSKDVPKEKFKQLKINSTYADYIISSYGRIFSIHYKNQRNVVSRLKTRIDSYGYEYTHVSCNGHIYGYNVHRLVALHFIRKSNADQSQVNHINGDKLDNMSINLEWVTPKENIAHAWNNKLATSRGIYNGNNTYSENQIRQVCELLENDISYTDIGKITGVSHEMISLILTKKNWTHISDQFDFSNYYYGKRELYHNICNMLENTNFSIYKISKLNSVSEKVVVNLLMGKHPRISKQYDFSNRLY